MHSRCGQANIEDPFLHETNFGFHLSITRDAGSRMRLQKSYAPEPTGFRFQGISSDIYWRRH